MRKLIIILVIIIGLSISLVVVQINSAREKQRPTGSVLYVGNYIGDPELGTEKDWFALHLSKGDWLLSPTTISRKTTGADGGIPETEYSSSVPGTRILLRANGLKLGKVVVTGGNILARGLITTCTRRPGCIEQLKLGDRQYKLKTIHLPNDKKNLETRVRLVLVLSGKKNIKQILIDEYTNYTVDLRWHLVLAGDLDGDGKIDLIANTKVGETGRDMLFLSSHAKKNGLVGLAGLTEW